MHRYRLLGLLLLMTACASKTPQERDQDHLNFNAKTDLIEACNVGSAFTQVKGSLWIKIKTQKEEMQFPATVQVFGTRLALEVTNLIGGQEATIQITGDQYEVKSPSRPSLNQKGQGSWNGIPVAWAVGAFLGRPPCLSVEALTASQVEGQSEGALLKVSSKNFIYKFRDWSGKKWIKGLSVQEQDKSSTKSNLEFEFERPDVVHGAPWVWRITSSEGELRVRWKDRELQ